MQGPEVISSYEVLFALRTGVTVLLPKNKAFDGAEPRFRVQENDILVESSDKSILLKNMKKNYLDAARERGFILFYELQNDEVVRSTLCHAQA